MINPQLNWFEVTLRELMFAHVESGYVHRSILKYMPRYFKIINIEPLCPFCGSLVYVDDFSDNLRCTNKSCGYKVFGKWDDSPCSEKRSYKTIRRICREHTRLRRGAHWLAALTGACGLSGESAREYLLLASLKKHGLNKRAV